MTLPSGIGVVGGAKMGLVMAHLAATQGSDVLHFVPDGDYRAELRKTRACPALLPDLQRAHDRVTWVDDLEMLAANARLILFTGAPDPIEETIDRLGEVLDGSHLLVHAIHRLYGPDLDTTSMLIRRRTCCLQTGALAGSLRLDELLAGQPMAAVVGSAFPYLIERVCDFLAAPQLCLFGQSDLVGVEYAATLVQIIEVAIGVAEALQLGAATQAMLVVRGLAEVSRLGRFLGASREAFEGLAGLAKLLVGVRRGGGPNYDMGELIVQQVIGEELLHRAPPEATGISLIESVARFAAKHEITMPITMRLDEVCQGQLPPRKFIEEIISSTHRDSW